VNVRSVDPREVSAETAAVYHVSFWSDRRRRSDEYELSDCGGVHAVLDWADSHADGREIEIAVVIGGTAAYLVGPLDPAVDPQCLPA
jgi:hypothetical protein